VTGKRAQPTKAQPGAPATDPKQTTDAAAKDGEQADSDVSAEHAASTENQTPGASGPATGESGRLTAISAHVLVKVANPTDARHAILAELEKLGGFASLITERNLELKVPPAELPKLTAFVAEQGLLVDKSLAREDLTLEIATLGGQLKSKRSILAELRSFFNGSDVSATLKIETSMNDLVKELEGVKGRIRVLSERAAWARLNVDFEFRESQRITYLDSQFEWLNSVNLERFLEEF
jgi:hypothetical protein